MKSWLALTPGWVFSAGIHLVLLLGATLVYLEDLVSFYAPDAFLVSTRSAQREKGFSTLPQVSDRLISDYLYKEEMNEPLKAEWDPAHDREGIDEKLIEKGMTPGKGALLCKPFKCAPPYPDTGLCIVHGSPHTSLAPRPSDANGRGTLLLPMRHRPPCGESATLAGLRWLARHQNADGSWSARDYGTRCRRGTCPGGGEPDHDTGVTALALLSFLGAGYSQMSKDVTFEPAYTDQPLHFGQTVKIALHWLLAHQDPEGCVGERGPKHLYHHAIATLALSEAYGMTSSGPLKEPAQKAVDFLVAAQNPGSGWRYSFRPGETDTAATAWAVMALKSAELSSLNFPKSAYAGALSWLDQVTDPNDGYRCGYTARGTGKVSIPGRNEAWDDHPTMTAISILSRIFMQKTKSTPLATAAQLLMNDLPSWKPGQVDFVYWYYGSLAAFQWDGPGGPMWKRWNEALKPAIIPNQRTAAHGCQSGSWDPSEDRWGLEGGRVYATAINMLSLECYYIYANVWTGSK